jgi:hypothetical protein
MSIILLLALVCGDDGFKWAVDSPSFTWAVGGGDESLTNDSSVRGTESPTAPSACRCGGDHRKAECSCRSCRCTGLVNAIRDYRAAGGQPAYVRGKTDSQHLVDDHGWSVDQVRGLTVEQQQYLHGASHAGKITPESVAAPVAPFSPETNRTPSPGAVPKPVVQCFTQDNCGPCRDSEGHNWSDERFAVAHTDDNVPEWVEAFPCYYWKTKAGGWHRYYGFDPAALARTWERTQ